ncbi:hypothetical protein BSKO_01640 [Bryopsis sp. KO-2023]|nr:hypothetical protein BSKO_01640 [Bryopsis sp. KO-2023]
MSLRQALRRGLPVSSRYFAPKQTAGFSAAAAEDSPSAHEPYSYVPPGRNHLHVPGPVNIPQSVLQAMQMPGQNHRDPFFQPIFRKLLQDVKFLFGTTKATSFIFSGTGTGGWESALTNTLSPGDKVVAFRYGLFSHLWIDMMRRLGLDVRVVDERWGDGADENKLEEILREDTEKKIKAVCVVHNETTTGVTSDIGGCRKAMEASSHPALLMVDGVSSIGALDFQMDKWGVDIAITGSQKALSMPTGIAVVCASDKALEARKTATLPRVYYDWDDQLKTNPEGNTPYTPSLHLLYGLRESLRLLKQEGMENVVARHKRLATGTRKAVEGWGMELLCKTPRWISDTLTVVETPGVDSNKVVKNAYSKYNLSLGIGLFQVNGKVFRIGHLGNMDELMVCSALSGTEMALIDSGVKVTPGSGVGRAIEYFQQTSSCIPTRESGLP